MTTIIPTEKQLQLLQGLPKQLKKIAKVAKRVEFKLK